VQGSTGRDGELEEAARRFRQCGDHRYVEYRRSERLACEQALPRVALGAHIGPSPRAQTNKYRSHASKKSQYRS
jgi:hypothetical protein